jgi:hypothetical protein
MDRSQRAMDQVIAASLLALVREHRIHCPGEFCVVSLSVFRPMYEALVGRECTREEQDAFA